MKHTGEKAKWHVLNHGEEYGKIYIKATLGKASQEICEINIPFHKTYGIKNIEKQDTLAIQEAETYAKLIVQAPPMYDFLIQLIEILEDKSETKDKLKIWEICVLKEAKEIVKLTE